MAVAATTELDCINIMLAAIGEAPINTLTGTSGAIVTAYAANTAGTISGLGDEAATVNSGTASVAQVNTLASDTSGTLTATVTEGDMSTLAGISESGNALTVTVTDSSVDAAALNTLDGKTTVAVTVNSSTVTGAAAAVVTAFQAQGSTLSGLDDAAANINSGTATVAQVNTVSAVTSGTTTATISDNDMSTLNGITGTGNAYTISVTDASVDAAELNALDAKTTVAVGVTSGTITGDVADVKIAYAAQGSTISGLGNENVTLNDSSIAATDINSVNGSTDGTVTVSASTVTGAAGAVVTASGLIKPAKASINASERKFIFVRVPGGWDTTRVFSPVFDNPQVEMEEEAQFDSISGLDYVAHYNRPEITNFFTQHAEKTAIVNGIIIPSINHLICDRLLYTANSSATDPDWGTRIAAAKSTQYPLPHVLISGKALGGYQNDMIIRVGENGQMEKLISGNISQLSDIEVYNPTKHQSNIADLYLHKLLSQQQLNPTKIYLMTALEIMLLF